MDKKTINLICLCFLFVLFLFSCGVHSESVYEEKYSDLWTTVEDAYVYCFPLVVVDATMKKLTNTEIPTTTQAPINQLIYNNVLFTADTKLVVSPNVDDVYSSAFLDLNNSAFIFVKPKTERFSSIQFLDAYTNTIDVIGSGSKADNPEDEVICLITGRDFTGDVPDGMKHITIPTDIAWIIIRTVINGPDDMPNVEAIQNQMVLVPLDVYLNNETYIPPKGTYNPEYNFNPVDFVFNMSPDEFFNTANDLMLRNPPASVDAPMLEEMQAINVGPGLTFDSTILGTGGTDKWNSMVENIEPTLIKQTAKYMIALGDWNYYGEPIGDWGTAYAYRGLVAIKGLGANPMYVAVYPEADTDSEGQQLSGINKYRLHIEKDMLPPVINDGFWSFTVYGSDDFLIPNEIDRYCINDRSNVTYNENGSLDILLQADKPDDEMVNNWLPVGTGDFRINLRIYGPDIQKIKNSWIPPKIVQGLVSEDIQENNSTEIWETVKDAYIFSYPLVLMDATKTEHSNTVEPTNKQAPINQFQHDDQLKNADWRNVVSPNVDTLYSQAFLNLNSSAMVFIKPKAERFCSAQIMDAFSNTIDIAGSGGGADNPEDEEICLIYGKNYQGVIPKDMTPVSIQTDLAWVIVRIVCNGPDDLSPIEAIQKQLILIPIENYLNNESYMPPKGSYKEENTFVPGDYVANMSPSEFFSTVNRLMIQNPPALEDTPIMEEIKTINVGPGLIFDEKILGENASVQWNQMLDSMNPVLSPYYLSFTEKLGDWVYYPSPIAEWGTDYPYRAIIAQVAFGANPISVAIYPEAAFDTDKQKLNGQNEYVLHFDEGMLPPVLEDGFWSITAYGSDSFLIPNEINRYCINDRSNVTYSEDGSLDILLQNENPESDLENNWLPVGSDDFHLIMRIYLPDMDKIINNWTVPKIEKQ